MAYLPVKARSEFVLPMNFAGGCVRETIFRFETASEAFIIPAPKPTRGSGVGLGALPGVDAEHAATDTSPAASVSFNTFMANSSVGRSVATILFNMLAVSERERRTARSLAFSPYVRFRSSDRRLHRTRT